ncbi:sugar phosphotransferase [Streptomyces roseoviridis]|uniref:Sugar phosphotransferase n=1 Tax=Streptomyces roseoviridis TaxID=67361 RepID=A0ABV5QWM1_9ACTN
MSEPGSMSSAAGVYQKVVPQPLRAVAASRVPPQVRRKVKSRLARTLAERESRLHRRSLRQVRDAGFTHRPEGRTLAPDGRVAHVHARLTADRARRLDHDLVTAALDMAGVPWFAVPPLDDRRTALAVPKEHKPAVRRVLRALLEEQTGYLTSVSPADNSAAQIPGSHLKAWKHFGKARVIRVVWLRTEPTHSLWIGENQGVEIEFWNLNTDLPTPRLVGPRPNRVQRVVPVDGPVIGADHHRLTGYAELAGSAEQTRTREHFDIVRVEEVTFAVDAVVLWQHTGPWAEELLRATLRSLHQYAPWTDIVHVVALAPLPQWVRRSDWLTVHSAGRDAEAHLHDLPDLAEHFLLFRPGAVLARPVRPFDFFTPMGGTRPRRGPWTAEEATAPWTATAFSFTTRAVAHGYGSGPQPYTRTVLAALADGYDWTEYAVDTQTAPQLTGTHPLDGIVHHSAHCAGLAEPSGETTIALHAAMPGVQRWLERLLVRRDVQQFQLFGLDSPDARGRGGTAAVLTFLRRYFPVESPFEHRDDEEGDARR